MNNTKTISNKDVKISFTEGAKEINQFLLNKLKEQKSLNIGFCGGRSIVQLLTSLRQETSKEIWQSSQFFFIDERAVDLNSSDSNFKLLNEEFFQSLLEQSQIRNEQIHPFKVDNNSDDFGLSIYNKIFNKYGSKYDLIFLGVGEDGHIASLFPNHQGLKMIGNKYFLITDSPKPPATRISITKDIILNSDFVVLLFVGEGKRNAYQNFLDTTKNEESCPAKICLKSKKLLVLTDII